jgi:hypothetical protein
VPFDDLLDRKAFGSPITGPQTTLEAVSLQLRADKNLSSEDAAVLEEVFRSTYDALVARRAPLQTSIRSAQERRPPVKTGKKRKG